MTGDLGGNDASHGDRIGRVSRGLFGNIGGWHRGCADADGDYAGNDDRDLGGYDLHDEVQFIVGELPDDLRRSGRQHVINRFEHVVDLVRWLLPARVHDDAAHVSEHLRAGFAFAVTFRR
jgi:hypothetical protein